MSPSTSQWWSRAARPRPSSPCRSAARSRLPRVVERGDRRRLGPERARLRRGAGQERRQGDGARGRGPNRRRHTDQRADRAGTAARRLLCHPSDAGGVPVPALARSGSARARVALAGGRSCSSPGRRQCGRDDALDRRDRGGAGGGRGGVAAGLRLFIRPLRGVGRGHPRADHSPAQASAAANPLRVARRGAGDAARSLLEDATGEGAVRRRCGTRLQPPELADELLGRMRSDLRRACRRMAGREGGDVVVFDLAPEAVAEIAGERLPPRVARAYRRYRHGPGAFKLDLAVEGGVPWTNEACRRAGTVHAIGSFDEIVLAERAVHRGTMPERPFVLVGQQYLADPERSKGDLHPVYVYGHVPSGYGGDASEAVLGQIERFAPGFRERIVASSVRGPAELVAYNANYVGGDIITGANTPVQILFRPRIALDPYSTGAPGLYICSAATPPGAGAHGIGGGK